MKKFLLLALILVAMFNCQKTFAQESFYNSDTIQEIKIYFTEANWDHILDSLYVEGQKGRMLAQIEVNGTLLDSIGIRYKGFSSVSVDRDKNPFNIKLDYVIDNQKYDGIDKIKLSNVIQDPSFLRETMSYEIARQYMPASRANYAKVFINDVYWGLYTNVEAVNKDFISQHYGSRNNAFFKCNPEHLDFDGENSNLGNSHGTDTTEYYPYYDIESDYGWADLYELIDILNENPQDIESILNVDRTLWMHAFNYALVNFDSYIGYAQNYYLYKADNGRFNPVIWDLNQSFASYRLTDASEHFDGFSIEQAKTIDPLLHYSSVSVSPRPLMRNLFENDTYRRMFLAHLRTIIEENFVSHEYELRGLELQGLIANAVETDTNKFYTTQDFYNNINVTVSDLVDYPGITDLMDGRVTYLQDYPGYQGAPDISDITSAPQLISTGDNIWITANIANATEVTLAYRFGGNGVFQKINMLDDGTQNDGIAGDGTYGAQLSNIGNSVQYYIYAENDEAGKFSPERAAYEYYVLQADISTGDIVINELMALNDMTVADEAGEYDDWIELYNTTSFDISTAGLYLSDNPDNLKKWALPDVVIPADSYLIVWADEDQEQGALHANFKLSGDGESLTLVDENLMMLDSVTFGAQTDDRTFGRYPNGTGPFMDLPPTFAGVNLLSSAEEEFYGANILLYPNPANSEVYLKFENKTPKEIHLFNVNGQQLKSMKLEGTITFYNVQTDDLANGIYFFSLVYEDFVLNRKLVIER